MKRSSLSLWLGSPFSSQIFADDEQPSRDRHWGSPQNLGNVCFQWIAITNLSIIERMAGGPQKTVSRATAECVVATRCVLLSACATEIDSCESRGVNRVHYEKLIRGDALCRAGGVDRQIGGFY